MAKEIARSAPVNAKQKYPLCIPGVLSRSERRRRCGESASRPGDRAPLGRRERSDRSPRGRRGAPSSSGGRSRRLRLERPPPGMVRRRLVGRSRPLLGLGPVHASNNGFFVLHRCRLLACREQPHRQLPAVSQHRHRQPALRGAVQAPEVSPRLPWPLPRHQRRKRLLPNVLPLVQHRASPWRDHHAHPGRRPSSSNPERAGPACAHPSSRLDPSSRTLRSRHPKTRPPSPSGLDQSIRDIHSRRHCSVNRNRRCLKVVDRFRGES